MIVRFEDLHRYRGQVVMVDGAFDPLHLGHIEYFAEAARLGPPLFCNVASDRYILTKNRPPLLPEGQRARIVDALRDIAYTHVNHHDTETVLRELGPRYYVKGADWKDHLPPDQVAICREHGIEIVYVNTVRDSSGRILSSSHILECFINNESVAGRAPGWAEGPLE
jgi:cytidyltransferase-like protein